MKTITSKQLSDKDNHTSCECGNKTIYEYSWSSDDGETICPKCMVAWQEDQIKALKELLYELSPLNKNKTAKAINQKYADFMGVDLEYFEDMNIDYSN